MSLTNSRKFIVNLIGPFLFLLRPWDIIVERKWSYLWLWAYLPLVLLIYLVGSRPFSVTVGAFMLITIASIGYIGVWIGYSIKDAVKVSESMGNNRVANSSMLISLSMIFPIWVATFIAAFALPTGNAGLVSDNIKWWGIAHLSIILILVLFYFGASCQKCFSSKRDRMLGLSLLGPIIGLQGISYLFTRNYIKTIGFVVAGLGICVLYFWVMGLYMIRITFIQQVFSFTILYFAPIIYFAMWLWSIEDLKSAVGSQHDSEETSSGPK